MEFRQEKVNNVNSNSTVVDSGKAETLSETQKAFMVSLINNNQAEQLIGKINFETALRNKYGEKSLLRRISDNGNQALLDHLFTTCVYTGASLLSAAFCCKQSFEKIKEVISFLDTKGIDITHTPIGEHSESGTKVYAVHYAAQMGRLDVLKYLVENCKCNINVLNRYNSTPLHVAALEGHKDVVKYLVENTNCNPNLVTRQGNNPLHFAAQSGSAEVFSYLADKYSWLLQERNNKGQTPLEVAKYFSPEIIQEVFKDSDSGCKIC